MGVGPVRPDFSIREWCGTGATNVTQPGNAQIDQGWAPGQKPPSSYENWFNQKVDRYLKYLDWQANLRPAVFDDFVRVQASGFTGFGPLWTGSSGGWQFTDAPPANSPAVGVVWTILGTSGTFDFHTRFNGLGDKDWRLEAVVRHQQRGSSGSSLEIGAFNHFGFFATGPSSTWGFQFTPSGRVATSIDMGVDPISTVFQKLAAERRGATMALYVNDVLRTAAPGVPMGNTGMDFGAKTRVNNALDTVWTYIDAIGLWRSV